MASGDAIALLRTQRSQYLGRYARGQHLGGNHLPRAHHERIAITGSPKGVPRSIAMS